MLLSYTHFSFPLYLPGPAYDFGAYQEMKAEVTEVPASRLIPEANHNFTGEVQVLPDVDVAAQISPVAVRLCK